jgi:hypothetical protein
MFECLTEHPAQCIGFGKTAHTDHVFHVVHFYPLFIPNGSYSTKMLQKAYSLWFQVSVFRFQAYGRYLLAAGSSLLVSGSASSQQPATRSIGTAASALRGRDLTPET